MERESTIAKGIDEGLDPIMKQGKANLLQSGIKLNNVYGGKRAGKTTHLINSFTKRINKKQMKGYVGFKRPDGNAAHILDRGTKERYTKRNISRGKITGNLFWTSAVEQYKNTATNELMDSVEKTINKIIDRNNR